MFANCADKELVRLDGTLLPPGVMLVPDGGCFVAVESALQLCNELLLVTTQLSELGFAALVNVLRMQMCDSSHVQNHSTHRAVELARQPARGA